MNLNVNKNISLFIILIIFFAACARMGSITGGPKDEQHPLIVKINPPNYTTNFDSKTVKITFDEFIQLKDLKKNLIISPIMDEKPIIMAKGKDLVIKFQSELKDSTTYNIYFGNSVQDFNEGNPIENFQYIFSTGEYVDSMSVQGQVLNSFNLLPEEEVLVMLYHSKEDSIPFKEKPNYISKTNKKGLFRINNIKLDDYKLFCLHDQNKNYIYDMPDEKIAFIDSLISFELITQTVVDTIFNKDTLVYPNTKHKKQASIDTIIERTEQVYTIPDLTLMLFKEDQRVQYLSNYKRDNKEKIELFFNKPIKDSIEFKLLDTTINNNWFIKEATPNNDSIVFWLVDQTLSYIEKLDFTLGYQKEDSNLVYQWTIDTLNMKYYPKAKPKKKTKQPSLKYTININNDKLDLNKNINLVFDKPIDYIDESNIYLFNIVDSLEYPINFRIEKVEGKLRQYQIVNNWLEDSTYTLEIYPGAFTNITESTNDTLITKFKVRKLDSYGKFLANITGSDSTFQTIVQLIEQKKEKEIVLHEKIIQSDQVVEFDYLNPQKYILKVILDKNKNGKWDEGNYLKHVPPEEVLYYEKETKVRANWDIKTDLNLKKQ